MKGITFGRHERKMGWRGAPNTPIFLDNVRVPVENLVGEEGKGFRASHAGAGPEPPDHRRTMPSGWRRARSTRRSPTPRSASSSSSAIAEFQGVQFMLADMVMKIEAARALVYECARAGDEGDWKRLNVLASMAKCFGQRHGDEGHHRRGAGLRRLRLHQGLPGGAHDARRQAGADFRRHQPDPAHGDRARPAAD